MRPLLPLLAVLLPAAARAHGGFHESEDVGEVEATGADPVVVTNYGLLTPVDGSDDWAWVCEEVLGPQGFSAAVEVDGRWLLGSFDGMVKSDDLCDWPVVEGPLQSLYVTGLVVDVQVPGRVWATTSSGSADNALWRSDDKGESWQAHATFEAGSTLRGMAQDATGLPIWVVGWLGLQPMAWLSTDGETWQGHPLPTEDVYSVSMLGAAEGAAWARLSGADSDALVRIDAGGDTTEVFRFEDVITAFDAGPGAGELYVGGKELGLFYSADAGASWSEGLVAPQPGCLRTRGEERFVCGHNWADGAAVLRTPLQGGDPAGWTWEPVVWFGDVRQVQDCPADSDTMVKCLELWKNASPEAGFDQDPTADGGADDSGVPDTGAPSTSGGGCCAGSKAGLVWLAPLLGLGALRRRR